MTHQTLVDDLRALIVEARRKAPTHGVQEWDWLLSELAALTGQEGADADDYDGPEPDINNGAPSPRAEESTALAGKAAPKGQDIASNAAMLRPTAAARLKQLTTKATDILNTTNDRYQVGRADGILEAVEAVERTIEAAPSTNAHELLAALKGVVRVADRKTAEFDAARAAIARAEGTEPAAQPGVWRDAVTGATCPSEHCPMCNGEACVQHDGPCECDVVARHTQPEPAAQREFTATKVQGHEGIDPNCKAIETGLAKDCTCREGAAQEPPPRITEGHDKRSGSNPSPVTRKPQFNPPGQG